MDYKIATPYGLYDIDILDDRALMDFVDIQKAYLPCKPVTVIHFDCAFGDPCIYVQVDIYDVIERLAIKDGIDVIEYENGCRGIVAYYNTHKSFIMILDEDMHGANLVDMLRLHSDRDFKLVK